MNKRALVWPHGHRVAVVCSVLLETWSDGKSPSYFPRTTPLPPGSKDVAGINWSRFGGNEGIWRLSRNLKDLDVPATLFCNGRSAEVWPEAVAAFAKSGQDVRSAVALKTRHQVKTQPVGRNDLELGPTAARMNS